MKLESIKTMLKGILEQFNSVVTDKGTLQFDEELKEGVTVRIVDEEGDETVPEDGEYYLGDEDGRTVVVESGVVKEIKEKDETTEEAETEETYSEADIKKQKFQKIVEAFDESYAEREEKIIAAIRTAGYDGWFTEAGDDFAVIEVWDELTMDYKHYRFSISWEGDEVVVGDYEEVKPAYVPVEENVAETSEEVRQEEDYASQITALQAEIEQYKARIAELEDAPKEEPAAEKFKKQTRMATNDNDKFNNLLRYCK